jgi:tetratricopeptide (TPR) repeat protein
MQRAIRVVVVPVLGFGLLLAGAVPVSADQWYEHYGRAEKALLDADHATAIAELNAALERRGDSAARARTYGMRVTAYFPYLKLGIAYLMADEPEAALRAFDTEAQLGAIQGDEDAAAQLEHFRRRATTAIEKKRVENEREIARIVNANLESARGLRDTGSLDEALAAVDRALALAPADTEATALAAELRDEIAERDDALRRQQRVTALITEGERHLAAGQLTEAATRFRQAVELAPDSAAAGLLEAVQRQLAEPSATDPQVAPGPILDRAQDLADRGELGAALGLIQQVLASSPSDPRAARLEQRVLAGIEAADRAAETERMLAEARSFLNTGQFESAIATANRALTRGQGRDDALLIIRDAYAALNRQLLGAGPVQNLPPAIRLAPSAGTDSDQTAVRLTREPSYRLSGVVIDESGVVVEANTQHGPVSIETSPTIVGGVTITEFTLDVELPNGTTTLTVSATDPQGLSSRSEVDVEYRRPLVRSPWAWGAVIATLAVVMMVVWVRRALDRRRLRRRRFNPFVAGPPVLEPGLFVGRSTLIDRVLATVPNNSLLLLGERRIGKTSMLQQLRMRLPDFDHPKYCFVPVSVDLQGVAEESFFATVAEAVGEVTHDHRMSAARSEDGYDSRELMRDLRRLLPTLECPDGRRRPKLVLLLDEIDELNGYSHRTNQRLRSLFMRSFADQLVAVAAGVGIARDWDHEGSPWYNFFEELEVGPVDRESARRLVTEPLAGVIAIDRNAVERLLEIAAGRPYILQKTALAAVSRVHEEGRAKITVDDVDAVAS